MGSGLVRSTVEMTPTTTSPDVSRLVAEVQQLSADVRDLLERLPNPARQWMRPAELAALVGCSVRSIASYRERGWIKDEHMRPTASGFEYRHEALADIEASRG